MRYHFTTAIPLTLLFFYTIPIHAPISFHDELGIGRVLDSASVLIGHQRHFMFLAGLALFGVLAIAWLMWLSGKKEG